MKIINSESNQEIVYVQYRDFATLLERMTESEKRAHFNSLFLSRNPYLTIAEVKNQFCKVTEPRTVEFIKRVPYIFDLDAYIHRSEDDLVTEVMALEEEKSVAQLLATSLKHAGDGKIRLSNGSVFYAKDLKYFHFEEMQSIVQNLKSEKKWQHTTVLPLKIGKLYDEMIDQLKVIFQMKSCTSQVEVPELDRSNLETYVSVDQKYQMMETVNPTLFQVARTDRKPFTEKEMPEESFFTEGIFRLLNHDSNRKAMLESTSHLFADYEYSLNKKSILLFTRPIDLSYRQEPFPGRQKIKTVKYVLDQGKIGSTNK